MKAFLLILPFLMLSCAKKIPPSCPGGEEVLREFSSRHVPDNFRIYAILRYGPVRLPMMLAKFDGFYTVRIAKAGNISVDKGKLCIDERCYLLPAAPESLVFGRVLSGSERSICANGKLIFEEDMGVYSKRVIFDGKKLKEVILRNVRKERSIRVSFGEEDERGFFREIEFSMGGAGVKLQIEEVEF